MRLARTVDFWIRLAAMAAFGILLHAVLKLPDAPPIDPRDAETILVLDVGHGGADPGTQATWLRPRAGDGSHNSLTLSEHTLCFDIASRIVEILEEEPRSAVVPVLVDTVSGFRILDTPNPPLSRTEALLTSPIYDLNTSHYKASVNLRWMLANSRLRELHETGDLEGKSLVFVSIHFDARHGEESEGLTVYVPRNQAITPERVDSGFYFRFEEHANASPRHRPQLLNDDYSDSKRLARALVSEFRERKLSVIDYLPIRSRIEGGHRPAVLAHNWIPCRVLLELGNLNDADDQDRITDPRYRQQMAEAIVDAVLAGGTPIRYGSPMSVVLP